jgi:hypothetical protein
VVAEAGVDTRGVDPAIERRGNVVNSDTERRRPEARLAASLARHIARVLMEEPLDFSEALVGKSLEEKLEMLRAAIRAAGPQHLCLLEQVRLLGKLAEASDAIMAAQVALEIQDALLGRSEPGAAPPPASGSGS